MTDTKSVSNIAEYEFDPRTAIRAILDSAPRTAEGQGEAAQRSVESVATDLLSPSPIDNVYFFTYFPYKGYEGISKLSDKLRKRFHKLFLVHETSTDGHIHYHGIGFSLSVIPSFELKGYCKSPWYVLLRDSVLESPPSHDVYALDEDNKDVDIEQMFRADMKTYFVNRYLTKQGQIHRMIHYMCKTNPKVLYYDYYLTRGREAPSA